MPLADTSVWFDSDEGGARSSRPYTRRPVDTLADPTLSYAIPATVPNGAPCWDVQERRPSPPLRRNRAEEAAPLLPTAIDSPLLAWHGAQPPLRRVTSRYSFDSGSLALLPPGQGAETAAQQFASQQSEPPLRRRPAPRQWEQEGLVFSGLGLDVPLRMPWFTADAPVRVPVVRRIREQPDIVLSAVYEAGLTPVAAWGTDTRPLMRTAVRRLAYEPTFVEIVGVSDIPTALIGWRDDTGLPRRQHRRTLRTPEPEGMPPFAYVVEVPHFFAALTVPPARPTPPLRRVLPVDDGGAVLWEGAHMAADARGRLTWDVPPHRIRRVYSPPRYEGGNDLAIAPIVQLALPWLPQDDVGAARRRQPWRGWGEQAGAEWAVAANLIVVAGPFLAYAEQMWQPGAVEAEISTPG